ASCIGRWATTSSQLITTTRRLRLLSSFRIESSRLRFETIWALFWTKSEIIGVLDEIGNYRQSLEQYNRALELYRLAQSQVGPNATIERGTSDAIANIGGDHLLLGDYPEALKSYQRSLSIDERLKLKPGICLDLQNIGLCLIGLGRLPEALDAFDRSIKLASEAGLKKEEAD